MGINAVLSDFFLKGSPLTGDKPYTNDDAKKGYKKKPSITGILPWLDIVDNNKILLEDGKSVAAVFDVTPVATEARSEAHLKSIRDGINRFVTGTFEELGVSPWTVQIFSWCDTAIFRELPDEMLAYAKKVHADRDAEIEPYTDHFINNVYRPHVEQMSSGQGIFIDDLTKRPWGGSKRKVHIVFYRRFTHAITRRKKMTAETELDTQCKRLTEMMMAANMRCERLDGENIWNFLFRWMNPNPKITKGDRDAWLKQNPYIKPEERTAEFDLSAALCSGNIESNKETQNWYFDGMPHTVVSIERMDRIPEIGQLTAEHYASREEMTGANAQTSCFIDDLPEGSIICITYVIKPQSEIRTHLSKLKKNATGDSAEARKTRDEIKIAEEKLLDNHKLYPYAMCIALRGRDDDDMDDRIVSADLLLQKNHLKVIDPEYDHFRLDRYIRMLPCAYDVSLDQVELRQRIIYTDHLANLLPFYGRSTGSGNPCIVASNRGGEGFCFDPLGPDRLKNAHLFLLGPTGAGKSATLVLLQMIITAIHNPRWVVVEAGNSFGLLSNWLKAWGKTTVDIVFRPGVAPSIAPYKPALSLVDKHGNVLQYDSTIEEVLIGTEEIDEADDGSIQLDDVKRDILGEMLIIARLMVTGGEAKEEQFMRRSEISFLKSAILNAASEARRNDKEDLLTEDVIRNLRELTEQYPSQAQRINEMAQAMDLFTDGFAGELFNRPGETLPDADYIRIEMGQLASGNDTNDKLSVAYISIINQVIDRAQRTQRDGRPTINLTDEAHVITCNPLLAKYLIVVSKLLGRRMGLWLWQATQNMEDYVGESKKMLAMFEWWMCLKIENEDLTNIEATRSITEDQRTMMLSTRKQSRAYTEGVVMSDNVQGLFRIVQPSLCLALAMTNKDEKQDRYRLVKKHGVTETRAAEMIGEMLFEERRKHAEKMLSNSL